MRRSLKPVLAALLPALLIAACSEEPPAPATVQLVNLVRFAESYDGRRVTVTGTVRAHPEPEHYWIEDSDLNRVAIQPSSAVSELVGETVRVTGRFRRSPERGRSIEVERTNIM